VSASAKGHPIAAFIVLLVITGLLGWLFSVMNSGTAWATGVGVLLFGFGAFAVLVLGRDDADEHHA
jgi:protein-S-isoprenylcysteine O-methyltransferase Ste14